MTRLQVEFPSWPLLSSDLVNFTVTAAACRASVSTRSWRPSVRTWTRSGPTCWSCRVSDGERHRKCCRLVKEVLTWFCWICAQVSSSCVCVSWRNRCCRPWTRSRVASWMTTPSSPPWRTWRRRRRRWPGKWRKRTSSCRKWRRCLSSICLWPQPAAASTSPWSLWTRCVCLCVCERECVCEL